MKRLKKYITLTGIMLLILSAASLYVSFKTLSEVRPAESYEDKGVRTFKPYDVLPIQVKSTSSRNQTKTVYMVYYRATDGSGYKWSDEVPARSFGEKIVDAGATVERRVLSIPEAGTYITVKPDQTAESYTDGLRERYSLIIGFAIIYIVFYAVVWTGLLFWKQLRREKRETDDFVLSQQEAYRAASFGPEVPEEKPHRWGGKLLLAAILMVLLAAFIVLGVSRGSSKAPEGLDSEQEVNVGAVSEPELTNTYLPPANEDGYLVATFPPALLGNKTPEEIVADFQKSLASASDMSPEELEEAAYWSEVVANQDGSVSYYFTPEQYQRTKRGYYAWGVRVIDDDLFGFNPSDIIKRLEYTDVDEAGIPWEVTAWVDQAYFQNGGTFSDFVARFIPMTMIGRYQIMCGVSEEEWTVHVTIRDAGTENVIYEGDFPERSGVAENAIPGSWAVPDGWVKAEKYSSEDKIFYIEKGHEDDEQPDNISIEVGTNRYSAGEHEKFREAVLRQFAMQLGGVDATLTGDGSFTEQGDVLYTFMISEKDVVTTQFYIVGDRRYCLVHLTNFTGSEGAEKAAKAIVDSFVWSE